jgi:hypothetical protein
VKALHPKNKYFRYRCIIADPSQGLWLFIRSRAKCDREKEKAAVLSKGFGFRNGFP